MVFGSVCCQVHVHSQTMMFGSVCCQAHVHGQTLSNISLKTVMAEGRNDDVYLVVFVFGSRNLPLDRRREEI